MRPMTVSYSPSVLDRDGIAAAQQMVGAGDLTLDGALVSGGVATMGNQQIVSLYSAGNLSARTFTVYGTDKNGNSITEAITGPNATTVSSTKNFYTVTRVAVNGAVASDVEVGVTGLGQSVPYALDLSITPPYIAVSIGTPSGGTYKMQYTYENVFASTFPNATVASQNWVDDANMTGKTGAYATTLSTPATAIRFAITTAGSPQGITGTIIQAGMSQV